MLYVCFACVRLWVTVDLPCVDARKVTPYERMLAYINIFYGDSIKPGATDGYPVDFEDGLDSFHFDGCPYLLETECRRRR